VANDRVNEGESDSGSDDSSEEKEGRINSKSRLSTHAVDSLVFPPPSLADLLSLKSPQPYRPADPLDPLAEEGTSQDGIGIDWPVPPAAPRLVRLALLLLLPLMVLPC
jgi:hypothetical protein